ncbi:MAG TPA: kelch repeat-containing protein, partial [Gaiellales bacterium]|nr:kelch repeat-containing protein [Gaiellales bacterium]
MLLLTDGTIMCQQEGGVNWWRLTPDQSGGYVNGRWKALAPMHHTRLYYASAVLQDGRVFVAGGEYSDAGSETNTAEIYDPLLDSWTEISEPPGWAR